MKNQPIDDLSSIQPEFQKSDPVVKTVSGALSIIALVFSFLCFKDVVGLINDYFSYRYKFVIGFELHSVSVAISVLCIPLIAYYVWLKRFEKHGFVPYLILLIVTGILFVTIYLLGLELIFSKSGTNSNPLLPVILFFHPFVFASICYLY